MNDFVRQISLGGEKKDTIFTKLNIEPILLLLLFILISGGLLVLYSASGQNEDLMIRQAGNFVIGFIVMMILAQIDPKIYQMWAPWMFIAGLGFLLGVLLFGVGAKGAQRWLSIPGVIRFQPSEMMKIAVPMMVAWYLASRELPPRFKYVAASFCIIFIPVIMIAKQPDLGTSLLISASGFFVLLFAGLSWRWIGSMVAAVAAGAPLMWIVAMHPYQKQRVLTFLNPESDPLNTGWNIIQSKTAIGSGGVEGKGWLQGTQSRLDFLPESHTDFIIAVLAEELGLTGVVLLLLSYLAIVLRGLYLAVQARDNFGRMLGGSLITTFFIYVFVNIGMVSGLLPVVGVPLPLVSYGGTSIVTLMASFGIIMSIYSHRRF